MSVPFEVIRAHTCEGSSIADGVPYHNIPGIDGPEPHRGNTEGRVALILEHTDVKGRTVADLGCSVGGIALGLAQAGATVTGLDHDAGALKVAVAAAGKLEVSDRASFYYAAVGIDAWDAHVGSADMVVWFSQFMWLVKQRGRAHAERVLAHVAKRTTELWFDAALGGMCEESTKRAGLGTVEAWEAMVGKVTGFSVENLGNVPGWHHRPVFRCLA